MNLSVKKMQPQQISRIDLGEIKAQIVKRIGGDKSKRYFYCLNKFLSQKLSKNDFDKLCYRLLGRENLPLHNHFMRSFLKNACQAKTSPPIQPSGPLKSGTLATTSPGREDGHEHSSSSFQNQSQNVSIWSNGVLPVSPRKMRSAIRDRKNRDRPSPLGPNGKVDSASLQSLGTEDSGSKVDMENGTLTPCDYQRPIEQLQVVAELPDSERRDAVECSAEKPRIHGKGPTGLSAVEDGEEVEQSKRFSRSPLLAPLGIPYCPASEGGAGRALPVVSTGDFLSCYDSGWLSDAETLRRRMEQIATVQGIGGVSTECANTLNSMLDVYLKRLIRSCVGLVEARCANELRKSSSQKQQIQDKVIINGTWPSNNFHVQSAGGSTEPVADRRPPCSVSFLDFKVAMELNPQQLGEDWPVLLEKISMHTFDK